MKSVKIIWNNTKASYRCIRRLWRYDRSLLRMKYLTEREINPKGKGLMKVKTAARVLSRSMTNALATGCNNSVKSRGNLRFDPFIGGTAIVVKEFDELFDYCNGTANPKDRKPQGQLNQT